MLYLSLLRRLRPCVGTQSITNISFKTPLFGKPSCYSGRSCLHQRTLSSVFKRSSHFVNVKMQCKPLQPMCLPSHSLSTSASNYSETGKLVYTGRLSKVVFGVKTFSYTTTVATMFMMPYVLFESQLATRSLAVQAIIIAIASLFTFVSPVLLHLLTKRYVIRLYHDAEEDTYTAVTYNVFMMEKKTVFKQGEVRIPAGPKMFTTFYAGPLGMMVDPDFFQLPSDYNHLMGYDQPFIFDENDLERPDKG